MSAPTYADGLRRAAEICQELGPEDTSTEWRCGAAIALEDAEKAIKAEVRVATTPPSPAPPPGPRLERLARRVCRDAWGVDPDGPGAEWQMRHARSLAAQFVAMADETRAIEDERTGRENAR